MKENNLTPIARLVSYQVAGLEPRVMGMGPIYALPKALKAAGMELNQLEQVELNEAFASQSVAVVKELGINPDIVNVNGGAIALGSSNKVLMLENAIYSVISPEGCATILWRDPKKTLEAAKAMKLSSKDLLNLEIIDEIIPEPVGGAHRDRDLILDNVRTSLRNNLEIFANMNKDEILMQRKNKFLSIGRAKGFTSYSGASENLSMKISMLDNIKTNILKNKKYLLILLAIIFLATVILQL